MSHAAPVDWLPATQPRSRAVMLAIGSVIVIETLGLHLWLRERHPALAWTLTSLSLLALAWLVLDYRALATAGVCLGAEGCEVRIGHRIRGDVPWTAVEQLRVPSWRDLPPPSQEYLNSARPDDPNLLFTFRAGFAMQTVIGRRRLRQLGVRVAQPERVVEGWLAWNRAGRADQAQPRPGR